MYLFMLSLKSKLDAAKHNWQSSTVIIFMFLDLMQISKEVHCILLRYIDSSLMSVKAQIVPHKKRPFLFFFRLRFISHTHTHK